MGARGTVRLARLSGEILTSAGLFNSGFESKRACALLPLGAARRLYPRYPEGTIKDKIWTPGGRANVRRAKELLEARVIAPDRSGPVTRIFGLISEVEHEIILSDGAISALGVKIEDPYKGLWRFAGERRVRRSARRRYW